MLKGLSLPRLWNSMHSLTLIFIILVNYWLIWSTLRTILFRRRYFWDKCRNFIRWYVLFLPLLARRRRSKRAWKKSWIFLVEVRSAQEVLVGGQGTHRGTLRGDFGGQRIVGWRQKGVPGFFENWFLLWWWAVVGLIWFSGVGKGLWPEDGEMVVFL